MSINLGYFFNHPGPLEKLADDLKSGVGCHLAPYEDDPCDLFCRFLGMELSLRAHTMINDRGANFEDFEYELDARTPACDADFRVQQVMSMVSIAYAMYRRLKTTGLLVFDTQIVLARYVEHEGDESLVDEVDGRQVKFPQHYLDVISRAPAKSLGLWEFNLRDVPHARVVEMSELGGNAPQLAAAKEVSQMPEMTCSDCGSADVMPDMTIVDHGHINMKHDLGIELHANPEAWIFKEAQKGVLKATICGQCGKVELSVDNARELWQIYKRNRDSSK